MKKNSIILSDDFNQSHTILGTRKLHSFVPISNMKVRVCFYSASNTSQEELLETRMIFHQNQLLALSHACVMESGGWLVY